MSKILVETRELVKVFSLGAREVRAVDGTDLAITTGEFVSIIGPSGSGKTTLLNLIGCIDYPTSGKVFINSRDISTLSEEALSDLRLHQMGFIFQTFNLLPNFTALENVVLPMAIAGVKDEERKKWIERVEDVPALWAQELVDAGYPGWDIVKRWQP